MESLFWFRVMLGLDIGAMISYMPPPSLDSCSPETWKAGEAIQNLLYDGTMQGIDLGNMEGFLKMVSNWIS